MRSIRISILAAMLAATLVVAADPKVGTYAGREWSIEPPPGYDLRKSMALPLDAETTAFFPDVRPDGSRPMVQLTLIAFKDNVPTMKVFAETMIGSIEERRTEWQLETSSVQLGELTVTRYAWSGVTVVRSDGAQMSVPARGVMLVGIDRGVGFALHAQDVAEYADETLAAGEQSLRTFRISN